MSASSLPCHILHCQYLSASCKKKVGCWLRFLTLFSFPSQYFPHSSANLMPFIFFPFIFVLQEYIDAHPETIILDPLPAIRTLLDRSKSYELIRQIEAYMQGRPVTCCPTRLLIVICCEGSSWLMEVGCEVSSRGFGPLLILSLHGSVNTEGLRWHGIALWTTVLFSFKACEGGFHLVKNMLWL